MSGDGRESEEKDNESNDQRVSKLVVAEFRRDTTYSR